MTGSHRRRGGRAGIARIAATLLLVAIATLAGLPLGHPAAASKAPKTAPDDLTIVVLNDGAEPAAAARRLGVKPVYVYTSAITGFAARLPVAAISAASRSGQVSRLFPDTALRRSAQTMPTGIDRIDAEPDQPGNGATVDADVAVLDTGVAKLSDMNVRTGKACIGRKATRDNDGHGTHTAGIIGARDNDAGVVGVAPGARIWAVKVLDGQGQGSYATVICGLDWVHKQRKTIDVVNMSLDGAGQPGPCGADALHKAICRVDAAGIVMVAAAGNARTDAATTVPATWPEVIAVSAFGDSDGQPGGAGAATCNGDPDDSLAFFSNYGAVVDVAAPGACIVSLSPGGGLVSFSGTSEAAPHVAGALARFVAGNPGASPAAARNWLLSEATRPQSSAVGYTGDPDAHPEPVLFLGS